MSQRDHGSAAILRPLLQCNFIRRGCPHQEDTPLFVEQYKRTNRTRATKIVRCFPHCCPEHRPRSYCGSSLHVEITTPEDAVATLHVFGRFEEHERPNSDGDVIVSSGLGLGSRVQANTIQGATATESIWVQGEVDSLGATPTQVIYSLRGSDDGFNHWEYDWKSGASQRQRLTRHHFRVYVFAAIDLDEWQVVGMTTSPPFTFSVYRKPQHNVDDHDSETASIHRLAVSVSTVPSGAEEDSADDDEAEDDFIIPPPNITVLKELVWHHQNRSVGKITTNMAILTLLACEGDPTWLTMRPRLIIDLLHGVTNSSQAVLAISDNLLVNYVNHCVPQLIALLPQRSDEAADSQEPDDASDSLVVRSSASLLKWQAAMELLAELLCYLLDPAQSATLLAFAGAHARLPSLSSERRREVFVQTVEMFAEQVEAFLQERNTSTEALVDDIVSIVLAKKRGSTYHRTLFLLRNVKVMGQSRFDAVLHRLQAGLPLDHEIVGSSASNTNTDHTDHSDWSGTWICRGFERAAVAVGVERRRSWPDISRPSAASAGVGAWSVGLTTAMNIILTAFGFDMTRSGVEGNAYGVLTIAPIVSPLGTSGGELVLDYTFRDITSLVPLEWIVLLVCGDHNRRIYCRARALGDGGDKSEIEMEFLVHAMGQERNNPWRCVLRFELQPLRPSGEETTTHPLVSPRRRMHVHVQVQEGQRCGLQKKSISDNEETKSISSSDGGSTTESENCERREETETLDQALCGHVAGLTWLGRAKFKCIYYAME